MRKRLQPLYFACGALVMLLIFYVSQGNFGLLGAQPVPVAEGLEESTSLNASNEGPHAIGLETGAALDKTDKEPSIAAIVANATLGFQKIIVISLPERADRRDTLALIAAEQGVKIDWEDGIRGASISNKTIPAHWNTGQRKLNLGELGNWRSICNALRRVVEGGYNTALVLEDDVDWDTSLKTQLALFAQALQSHPRNSINPSSQNQSTEAFKGPYGSNWDILWLGSCANPPAGPDAQTFVDTGGQHHYLFYVRGGMACTWAYAVTHKSAKMLLGWLQDINAPTDFHMSRFCKTHECVAVWPELFATHRPAGALWKGTDIHDQDLEREKQDEVREVGETPHVLHSSTLEVLEKYGPTKDVLEGPN